MRIIVRGNQKRKYEMKRSNRKSESDNIYEKRCSLRRRRQRGSRGSENAISTVITTALIFSVEWSSSICSGYGRWRKSAKMKYVCKSYRAPVSERDKTSEVNTYCLHTKGNMREKLIKCNREMRREARKKLITYMKCWCVSMRGRWNEAYLKCEKAEVVKNKIFINHLAAKMKISTQAEIN